MTGSLFGEGAGRRAPDQCVVDAYAGVGRTLDDLPYTDAFESLMARVRDAEPGAEHREVFHRLHTLRKAGRLPRLGVRGGVSPVRLSYEHEQMLIGMVVEAVGSLGQRDRLPYSETFDGLAERFAGRTGLNLTRHDLWRLIARLAK